MKTLHYILCLALAGFSFSAQAQTSLQDQIRAVHDAHQTERVSEKAEVAAQKAEKAAAAKRAATAKALKEKQARADKKHLQDRAEKHEDALRELELEAMRIELEEKRARAKRTNDFIDRELNMQDAKTDLVQSEADAKRDISSGTKQYLLEQGDNASVQIRK